MSEVDSHEALIGLQRDLIGVSHGLLQESLNLEQRLLAQVSTFQRLLDKAPRNSKSRDAIQTGKITLDNVEYQLNQRFVEDTLKLADEVDLDELEAAKLLLDTKDDPEVPGRPLLESGIIRFHARRERVLECIRLCLQIADNDELDQTAQEWFGLFVDEALFRSPGAGRPEAQNAGRIVPRCLAAMQSIRTWLQNMADKVAAASVLGQSNQVLLEFQDAIRFSRKSLTTQHETLAVILRAAINKRQAEPQDFKNYLAFLKKVDRYDQPLVHLLPALGAFINSFGSTECRGDFAEARAFNDMICPKQDDDSWLFLNLRAAVRVLWIAEYSGWFLDGAIEGVDVDKEDEERTKTFLEALKDGAFDFILAVAADCKPQEWHDHGRTELWQWLQRKSPSMSPEPHPFHHFFRQSFMEQLEVFIDASISGIPDVLRRLKTEEDEQRQLSQGQAHQQDKDLERFLVIVSCVYEGRPDAAMAFWEDKDSNLFGFLQWASKRASTPLMSAFCEMLRSLADNEVCANAAHKFLLDEGPMSSGKMRRSNSLTWGSIIRELEFFTLQSAKAKDKKSPMPSQQRLGKTMSEQAEREPESNMVLESYLKLMAKLSTHSPVTREKLCRNPEIDVVEMLLHLASDAAIFPRLRACIFQVLTSFLVEKDEPISDIMWSYVERWIHGGFRSQTTSGPEDAGFGNFLLDYLSQGFEQPNEFIQLLVALVTPPHGSDALNDALPFPDGLNQHSRGPRLQGINTYVDYVLGVVFAKRSAEIGEVSQRRLVRLGCLRFALVCLKTFNEDLIILGNETNLKIDAVIRAKNLASYIQLHPFARVMDWIFNEKVIGVLFSTIQDRNETGDADPESPLLQGIQLAIEIATRVLDLQATYLDIVRPVIKQLSPAQVNFVSTGAYSSFEDAILQHLTVVVDLGAYCNLGSASLTLASLKLLEKISASSRIVSAWNPGDSRQGHRNKAIVALERDGQAEVIAASLASELLSTLDLGLEASSSGYEVKHFILDFLYACLKASPGQPTIAHLLLGFRCQYDALSVDAGGAFDSQKSLFHALMQLFLELPLFGEEQGMRTWLLSLRHKLLRILQFLWTSSLSSMLVMQELSTSNFAYHVLLREVLIGPQLKWDGVEASRPNFMITDGPTAFLDFLLSRALEFEYLAKELCMVSQRRMPRDKQRLFDALIGFIKAEDGTDLNTPSVFDFYDFFVPVVDPTEANFERRFFLDIDLEIFLTVDIEGVPQYDLIKINQALLLKRREGLTGLEVNRALVDVSAVVEQEEEHQAIILRATLWNRREKLAACQLHVLKSWTSLLLVMLEAHELKAASKQSFLLQALQTILPNLETFSTERPHYALELAKLAKGLLFNLDLSPEQTIGVQANSLLGSVSKNGTDRTATMGNLISDKLFRLFQICPNAIGKWTRTPELRAIYYSICYRYITKICDQESGAASFSRCKAVKLIQNHGERLLHIICDDASGSDSTCQISATILLASLVQIGRQSDEETTASIIETLNRLNFIGVLVESLKNVLADWLHVISTNNVAGEQYMRAKLALLQLLCQTRTGAKFAIGANLFRTLEASQVFAKDPDLEIDSRNTRGLARLYELLATLARIVAAAVVVRGEQSVLLARKFLTQHRLLLVHVLKRSAGIGGGDSLVGLTTHGLDREAQRLLRAKAEELAEAFILLIKTTGFLEFEDEQLPGGKDKPKGGAALFH